jgi:hypothetical protein
MVGIAVLAANATAGNGGLGYESKPTESSDGSTIIASPGATLGAPVRLRGTITGLPRGAAIEIQRLDAKLGWVLAVNTTAGNGGSFDAYWTPTLWERTSVRAIPGGGASIRAASALPSRQISVYKSFNATWYGPGLWGNRLGCTKRKLTRATMGVAHKTLPCGTRVEFYYKGRTVTVPVVDRGPFRTNTAWDLTYAAAKALRFKQTDKIGAVAVAKTSPAKS